MFFLTYILQYIFSLSKNTHTCPIFVCGFPWQQIGSGQMWDLKKNHVMLVLNDAEESQRLVDVLNSQNGSGECCDRNKQTAVLLQWAFGAAAFQRGFYLL